MRKSVKNGLIIGGIADAFLGLFIYPLTVLAKFRDQVSVNITGIKSLDVINANLLSFPPQLGEVRIIFDLIIDNPLNSAFTFTIPYIRAFVGESTLGNSRPRAEKVVIQPSQRTIIQNIDFRIPTNNVISVLGINQDYIKNAIQTRSIRLNKKINFEIGVTVNGNFTTITQEVNL